MGDEMTQPEALRLADELERVAEYDHQVQAAAELRRLYQVNLDLLSELYVLRASKHLKDVTAAYKKIAEEK